MARWNALRLLAGAFLALAQTAWTVDVAGAGRIAADLAAGADEQYPALALSTGHPYLWLTGRTQVDAGPTSWVAALNSGRVYPVAPTAAVGPFDYRERYFIDNVYGQVRLPHLTLAAGRMPQSAAAGRLTSTDVPAARITPSWRDWQLDLVAAKAETTRAIELGTRTHWLQGALRWQTLLATVEAGHQWFRDPDGLLSDVYNPMWPIVPMTSDLCALSAMAYLACWQAFAGAGAFLFDSETELYSTWLRAEGLWGPMALAGGGIWQAGSTSWVSVPVGSQFHQRRFRHNAGAAEAQVTWVGEWLEAEVGGLWLSGDAAPLGERFSAFLGVQSLWTDSTLFFGGGANADMQTATFQTGGRMSAGVRSGRGEVRLYFPNTFAQLKIMPLWSDRRWDRPFWPESTRWIGLEIDGRLVYDVTRWLAILGDVAWLGAQKIPVFDTARAVADPVAVASDPHRGFVEPGAVWQVMAGIELHAQGTWTNKR